MSHTAIDFDYTLDTAVLDGVAEKLVTESIALDATPQGTLESLSMALAVHFNLVRDGWSISTVAVAVIASALEMVKAALQSVKERDLWASVGMPVPAA